MTDVAPSFLADAVKATPQTTSEDRLKALRAEVARIRDLQADKGDLEDKLKGVNIAINKAQFTTLPDLFDELGISVIELAPEGNHPGVKAEAKPFYRAGIAASWDDDKREAAFQVLTEEGAEDLIKTSVVAQFPRGAHAAALAFAASAPSMAVAVVKEEVHAKTLTAWLREQVEKFKKVPEKAKLEALGASVGRSVTLKPLKEKF